MTDSILVAAAGLYHKNGADFTLEMLADETGLSRATLYRRIGSKEALIAALAARGLINPDNHADLEERVLAAARRVVAEYGFLACTMEQIAREAGIGVATLYRRFRDKERLLGRLAAEPAPKPVIRQAQATGEAGFEAELRQLIEVGLHYGSHNRDAVRAILSASKAEETFVEEQRHVSADAFARMVDYMQTQQRTKTLRSDVSAANLAMMLSGMIMQFALFGPAYLGRSLDVEADAGVILALFLKAAAHSA